MKKKEVSYGKDLSLVKSEIMHILELFDEAEEDEETELSPGNREFKYLAERTLKEIESVQQNNGVVIKTDYGKRVIPVTDNVIRSFKLSIKHIRSGLPSKYRRLSQRIAREKRLMEDNE